MKETIPDTLPLNGGLTPLDCYHIGVLVCEALSFDPSDEVREAAGHLRGLVEASGALDSRFADLPPTKAVGAPLTPPQGGSGARGEHGYETAPYEEISRGEDGAVLVEAGACEASLSAPAERKKPARKPHIWDEEKLAVLRRMYDARQTDAAIAEACGLKAQQVANRISYELKHGTLRKVDRSGNIGRTPGGGRKAAPESRSVPPLEGEVSSYEENGVVVTKCPPGYAIGATPQKNVGCSA